jgi:hypothetical protein
MACALPLQLDSEAAKTAVGGLLRRQPHLVDCAPNFAKRTVSIPDTAVELSEEETRNPELADGQAEETRSRA